MKVKETKYENYLVINTCSSFKESNRVTVHKLRLILLSNFSARSSELNVVTCLEKMFSSYLCSWFNYEIIKDLVAYFDDTSQCHMHGGMEEYEIKIVLGRVCNFIQ